MKKKALLISPVYPDSAGDGRQKRAHQWATALGAEYDVSLLVVRPARTARTGPPVTLSALPAAIRDVQLIEWEDPAPRKAAELLLCCAGLLAGRPRSSAAIGDIPLRSGDKARLTAWYEGRTFDYVLCFRLYLQQYALFMHRLVKPGALELDLDDIESSTRASIAARLGAGRRYKQALLTRLSARCFRLIEERLDKAFTQVYVCSEEDRRAFARLHPGKSIAVMPNRLCGAPPAFPLPADPYRLLFVGSLDYYPNEEALRWFIREVLPELRSEEPRWTLDVAGFGGSPRLRRLLETAAGVRFHGSTASLTAIYAEAYIVVVPLRAGGGTKLKTLEAMWHGRPVVSTAEGVRGLGLRPSVHYRAAQWPAEFVKACRELAAQPENARRYGAAAQDEVAARYCYEARGREAGPDAAMEDGRVLQDGGNPLQQTTWRW